MKKIISEYKEQIGQHVSNLPGWSTTRKIIVIESDDWGSIRMPSKEAYQNLKNAGLQVRGRYNKYDSLESNRDLENLFEVVAAYKDNRGKSPVFTSVCVVANPDFEKIRESEYREYFFEPFTESLKRHSECNRVLDLWKEGANRRLFVPQFHGREHLNVQRWLRDLQDENRAAIVAFQNQLWGLNTRLTHNGYQAAFDLDFPGDLNYLRTVIEEGLDLFTDLLGYQAKYFVPPNGPFNLSLEETLHKKGIKYITLDKRQKEPLGDGKYRTRYRYLGKRNRYGQVYLSRNAAFEPSAAGTDWITKCMKDIEIAFRMKKPAVISTHRVNYIGSLDSGNRDRGLMQLRGLLDRILKIWPEVEFMTSVELGDLISGEKAG